MRDVRLEDKLPEWVEASLITPEQAKAIRAHESEEPALLVHGRVPLLTEALGYLGAGLAVAALVTLLAEDWPTYPLATRLAVPLLGAILLTLAGWPLRDSAEPAFSRFGSVLWALAVASTAWFAGVLAEDALGYSDRIVQAYVGALAGAVALILYVARRSALQMAALAITGMTLLVGLVSLQFEPGPDADPAIGVAMWTASLVWLLLAYRRVLVPTVLAYALGAWGMIMAPGAIASPEGFMATGLLLGLFTAFGLIGASVWLRDNVLLAFGVLGAFMYLIRTIQHFFGDSIGMPLVLLTTGVILLAVAYLTMRLRRTPGPNPPAAHAA